MHHLIFSISALLGTDVVTSESVGIGVLEDVICNKDTGKITYMIISAGAYVGSQNQLYAVHHSYFYLNGDDEMLIFDPKIGKEDHSLYLDLPEHYDDATVQPFDQFTNLVVNQIGVAGHRSDYD